MAIRRKKGLAEDKAGRPCGGGAIARSDETRKAGREIGSPAFRSSNSPVAAPVLGRQIRTVPDLKFTSAYAPDRPGKPAGRQGML